MQDNIKNCAPELPDFTREENERFNILSPDGFSITREDQYNTVEEAKQAFEDWKKGYEKQGYYSSNDGRIPLDQLERYCTLIVEPAYKK